MKRVFCLFLDFFHGGKTLFTSTFSKFSRLVPTFHGDFLEFFHGFNLRFHGHKIKNLLGRDVFFTGIISEKISKATVIILGLIKTKNLFKKIEIFHVPTHILVLQVETCSTFSRGHSLFNGHFINFLRGVSIFYGHKTKNLHRRQTKKSREKKTL